MPPKDATTMPLEARSGDPDDVFPGTPDRQLLVAGVQKWRVCGLHSTFPQLFVTLFDASPFYPAFSVFHEDTIRLAGDVNKYVPRDAEYVQGRTTTEELRIRCLFSIFILMYLSIADGQGNDFKLETVAMS